MATRLLGKGQIVKVGAIPHKLLSDVEAETATADEVVSELAKKASKARWDKRTKEERSEHAKVMLRARWSKSTGDPLKSQEMATPVPDAPSTVDESKTIEDSKKLLGQILTESSIQRRTEKEAKPEPALMKALTTLLPKAAKPQTEDDWAALDWELTDKELSKLTGVPLHIVQATHKQLMEMGRI